MENKINNTKSEDIRGYDQNGNCIHYKDSNGLEDIREYDQNNNCIHYKDSNGYEYWKEYDQNSNCIHYKDSNGFEEWKEYDQNGKIIHYKDSDGFEEWKEYDQNGKIIHYKDSDGFEEWYAIINGEQIDVPHDVYEYIMFKLNIKKSISEIIECNSIIKNTSQDKNGCFKNIIIPAIMDTNDDNIIETLIAMLANQSAIYDRLLDNIAKFGSKELIEKCNNDIKSIFSSEE